MLYDLAYAAGLSASELRAPRATVIAKTPR